MKPYDKDLYTLENEMLTLAISRKGAELWSLHSKTLPGKRSLLWHGSPDIWPWRAPLCFPWCGRVEGGWFEEKGVRYKAGLHGFVREYPHCIIDHSNCKLQLRFDWPGDNHRWPWGFSFHTLYELRGSELLTACTAVNSGDSPMPVQMGFHPGLSTVFSPDEDDEYILRFYAQGAEEPIKIIPLRELDFSSGPVLFRDSAFSWIQLEAFNSNRYLRINTKGYPVVLLWSKPGIPGFLCIEPWSGYYADGHDMSKRPGTRMLMPGESAAFTCSLSVGV